MNGGTARFEFPITNPLMTRAALKHEGEQKAKALLHNQKVQYAWGQRKWTPNPAHGQLILTIPVTTPITQARTFEC